MKEFLEFVIHRLVEQPEEVVLHDTSDEKTFRFRLELPGSEVGKIIGRGGQTVGAIRNLLGAAAARQGKKVHVEIAERPGGHS